MSRPYPPISYHIPSSKYSAPVTSPSVPNPQMAPFQSASNMAANIAFENISDGETVHQRCVLITGQCISSYSDSDFLTITSHSSSNTTTFPPQTWPISSRRFKALIVLSPGPNILTFNHNHKNQHTGSVALTLTYIPLLQTPPLHLAILIAKDSPLLIDCPPSKQGGISSTHADLNAAINKFRMTAYMWQALTAEDMRSKGLGRRSFRIEEEWSHETLSSSFFQMSGENHMRSTAKIHLVKTEKTVTELRNKEFAQQNQNGSDRSELFKIFDTALLKYGGPFASEAHPVVAGLILDSAYSVEQDLILGHAALGCSRPNGLSLGIFGSHTTYAWPRFLEEVPACLLDTAIPGDIVADDNGECGSMWEACSIGQGAFLHEVGHAFGAGHTSGIMERGYAGDWTKNFLPKTAFCKKTQMEGEVVVDGVTANEARWDLKDALAFKVQNHFRLPSDPVLSAAALAAEPNVQVVSEAEEADFLRLVVSCPAQIVRLKFNDIEEVEPTVAKPVTKLQFTIDELEARFDKAQPLTLDVLGMNGKSRVVGNVWKLFSQVSFIRIPGSSILLQKRSVVSPRYAMDENQKSWDWAVLLQEKGLDGNLSPATMIDSRVGCRLDGAVVYFKDTHKTPCGPRWRQGGEDHSFGGHLSQKIKILEGVDIVKVEVGKNEYGLNGLRFHLSNGSSGGYLYKENSVQVLEPLDGEKIIGFYGSHDYNSGFCETKEFGIITAPKGVELPEAIYDMPELQNTDGGNGPREQGNDDESDGTMDDGFETDEEDKDEDMEE